jgi:hypothetical protein
MTADLLTPTDDDIILGVRLLEAKDEDALSCLGFQAEKLEIAQLREEQGRAVPEWSNVDAVEKVLSGQRASPQELIRYAQKGVDFARILLDKTEQQLRGVLCAGNNVNPEIEALSDNAKEILKYVSSAIVGVVLASLPAAVALAAAGIATTLAVILIKRGLRGFCAVGAAVVTNP